MNTLPSRVGWLASLALAGLSLPSALTAQITVPSSLRHGSGLIDVPVASVLPHLAVTGTYSNFFLSLDRVLEVNENGDGMGFSDGYDRRLRSDAAVAIGLFDRAEIGATIQAFSDPDGDASNAMWGLFGRLQLLQPTRSGGLGLAAGGRYVMAPEYGGDCADDCPAYQPGRLGFPDRRFTESYAGRENINTELSLYGVASAHTRGFDIGPLPRHDFTIALGYGTGMFQEGGDLSFYSFANSKGWFFGSAVHFGLSESSLLTFMGDYNGFDVNIGTQLDVSGIRLGAHYLGANYSEPNGGYYSEYRRPKLGFLASIVLDPNGDGLLRKPRLVERSPPDTIILAPPPDTVEIVREVAPPLPEGMPATICLATGESVEIHVSARGDTLVGPARVSIESLRPGVDFVGAYAAAASWFLDDESIVFEGRRYDRSGNEVGLDCGEIMRVGEHMTISLFAMARCGASVRNDLCAGTSGRVAGLRVRIAPDPGRVGTDFGFCSESHG